MTQRSGRHTKPAGRSRVQQVFHSALSRCIRWIGERLNQTKDDEIANHVREAYRMAAPKKLLA
jgi:hypothetical protein